MIRKYDTINSFTRKPVLTQIVAYLVFIGEALTFFICMYVNFRNTSLQILIFVLYIMTAFIQIIVSLMASYIDPSDNIMIEYRNNEKNRKNMNINNCLYCDICTSYVKETSRHCKACQRCVQQFDHHCMWINNCIGSKNYNVFFAMIISTFVNMIVYVIGMFLLWTEGGWRHFIGPMVAVWVFSVIILVFSILLLNLIILHIILIYKGLTTYQFIMMQRQQEKKRKLQQQHAKQLQEAKKKQASIEHQIKGKLTKRVDSESEKQQSSSQKSSSENSKQIYKINENLKSESSSNVIFKGKNELQNDLRTQKSQEQSTYEGKKKKTGDISIIADEFQQNEQNMQYGPISSRMQHKPNISNFFTKNKSLKIFTGTQIGQMPKSTTHRLEKNVSNYFHTPSKDGKQLKTNKSMFATRPKNIKQQKSAKTLKTINFQQDQITPPKFQS